MYKLKNKVLISILTMLLIVFGCCLVNKSDSKVLANDTESISSEMLSALSVKCQVKENTDGSADLRIVSTVDVLKTYGTAGFDIYVEVEKEDGEKELELLHKYERPYVTDKIGAKEDGVSFEYNPKVFDTISNYFITVTITGIPESDFGYGFLIKPFVTMSGSPNHYLYGESRFVKVNDALDGEEYLSVPVAKLDDTTGCSVKVGDTTYSSDAIEFYNNATYDANYTHVRVKANPSKLQSITEISVLNGEQEVAPTTTYRNLYSTSSTADTTWYDYAKAGKYVLATKADLLGLEKIVNDSKRKYKDEQFLKKTIYLGADVVVNDTTAVQNPDTVEGWNGYTPQITWKPIGNSTKKFSGIFDGMNQSICGIYISGSDSNVGLFGVTVANTKVENLTLRNSYIKGYSAVGSIVGEGGGTFTNVHSNAVVISDNKNAGGILGSRSTAIITLMKKCSYFGEVSTTGKYNNVGGFVGLLGGRNAKFTFEDCEFMGSVYTSGSQGGGFIGGVGGQSEVVFASCNAGGTVTIDSDCAGGYIGVIAAAATISIKNSKSEVNVTAKNTMVGGYIGKNNSASKVTISNSISRATVTANTSQAGGFIGYVAKPTELESVQFAGSVISLQQVGGFIGAVYRTTLQVTDCLMSGTVQATRQTTNESRNAGGLCGIVLEGTTTAKGTVNATRCLITGKIVYVADDNARCGEHVGQVQANNTYNAIGVYARTGCCENENFCGSVATECWGDNLNNGRFTEKELTGENALQKVTALEIDTATDGTSTWVATKNSYPTLRIFANENDILIR